MHYCHKELDKFQIYLEGGVAWLYLMFKGSFKMFYKPEDGHGLKHNPFNAIVTPRPIGWISTRDKNSIDNIAPYSFLMRLLMFLHKLCLPLQEINLIEMELKTQFQTSEKQKSFA